jgi:hypothetical protein
MDQITVNKNADRVAAIFNALSIFVLIIGAIGAVVVLLTGFVGGFIGRTGAGSTLVSILSAVVAALAVAIYTAITWAGVQLAALVAGYIKVRTQLPPASEGGYPTA